MSNTVSLIQIVDSRSRKNGADQPQAKGFWEVLCYSSNRVSAKGLFLLEAFLGNQPSKKNTTVDAVVKQKFGKVFFPRLALFLDPVKGEFFGALILNINPL